VASNRVRFQSTAAFIDAASEGIKSAAYRSTGNRNTSRKLILLRGVGAILKMTQARGVFVNYSSGRATFSLSFFALSRSPVFMYTIIKQQKKSNEEFDGQDQHTAGCTR